MNFLCVVLSRLVQNCLHDDTPEETAIPRLTETGKYRPESYKVLEQVMAIFLFFSKQQVHVLLLLVLF